MKTLLLALLMTVPAYAFAQIGKLAGSIRTYELKINIPPKQKISFKKIVFVHEDETARELASTMMNSFMAYHEVYTAEPNSQPHKSHPKAAIVQLRTVAAEFEEAVAEVKSLEFFAAKSEARSETDIETSVRMKINVKVSEPGNGRMILVEDFSFNDKLKGDIVLVSGKAIKAIEKQIKETFLPGKAIHKLPYFVDPKYGLEAAWPAMASGNFDGAYQKNLTILEHIEQNKAQNKVQGKKGEKKFKRWQRREARVLYNQALIELVRANYDPSLELVTQAQGVERTHTFRNLFNIIPQVKTQRTDFETYQASIGVQKKKTGANPTLKARLSQLKDLYESDLLTREEYDSKKSKLLSTL